MKCDASPHMHVDKNLLASDYFFGVISREVTLSNGLGSDQSNYAGRGLTPYRPLPEGSRMRVCLCVCACKWATKKKTKKKTSKIRKVCVPLFPVDEETNNPPFPFLDGQWQLKTNDFTCSSSQNEKYDKSSWSFSLVQMGISALFYIIMTGRLDNGGVTWKGSLYVHICSSQTALAITVISSPH